MQILHKTLFVFLLLLTPIMSKASPWADFIGYSSEAFIGTLKTNKFDCNIELPREDFSGASTYKHLNEGVFSGEFDNPAQYTAINNNYLYEPDMETYGEEFESKIIKNIYCKKEGAKFNDDRALVSAYFLRDKLFKLSIRFNFHCQYLPFASAQKRRCHKKFDNSFGELKNRSFGFVFHSSQPKDLFFTHKDSFYTKHRELWDKWHRNPTLMETHYEACSDLRKFQTAKSANNERSELNAHCELSATLEENIWSSVTLFTLYKTGLFNKYSPQGQYIDRRDFVDIAAWEDAFVLLMDEVEEHFINAKRKYTQKPEPKLLKLTD